MLNVAGIGTAAPLAEVMMEDHDRTMDVDLRGVFLGTKHGIKTMLPTGGGVIVNWSSTGGMHATPFPASVYSAAKAAAVEYGTQGIRAITICPGFIETDMSGGPGAAERLPQLVQGTALKWDGQPEKVAELTAFLCSDRSPYITGAVIPVHGGMSRGRRRRLPRRPRLLSPRH